MPTTTGNTAPAAADALPQQRSQLHQAASDDEIGRRIAAARRRMPASGLWAADSPVVCPEMDGVTPGAYRRPVR